VQTPTLALIVSREEAVQGFVSESFYTPEINCGGFAAFGEKQKDAAAAEAVRAAADGRDVSVLSAEKAKKTAAPPKLYDLTTLQREANRLFSFTAQQTLDCAQSLYEKKLITYPRTDSRFLTGDMKDGLEKLVNLTAMKLPFIKVPVPVNAGAVINDAKVTDHHAIIPTPEAAKADVSALPSGESLTLRLLITRLVCAVAPAHRYEAVTAVLECGGHHFTAKGMTVLDDGWKATDTAFRAILKNKPDEDGEDEDGAALPELSKGQTFNRVTASVKEGKTSPPRRYTEDTLLSAMETAGVEGFPDDAERKGLGTPATRAATIEKLVKSGFAERQKKNLIPTEKGIRLIAVLPETVKSPLLTAEWEQALKLIERGELAESAFMDGIANMVRKLVADHAAPIPEYADLFADPARGGCQTKREAPVGVCPRCGKDIVERQKGFFCSGRDCKFALWKDNRFFAAKKKKLDKKTAAALLSEGRVFFSDLYSEKTGKTYAAVVLLEDAGDRVNYKLDFKKGGTA
jgi:DNA topoisomerase-3